LRGIPVGPIATLKDWNSKGRYIKRGEKAIWLCMPIIGKKTVEDETSGEEAAEHYKFFVWKPRWFVLAQTEGQEYRPDVASNAWNRARALSTLQIDERPFEMLDGNCQGYSQGRTIAINPVADNRPRSGLVMHLEGSDQREGRVLLAGCDSIYRSD